MVTTLYELSDATEKEFSMFCIEYRLQHEESNNLARELARAERCNGLAALTKDLIFEKYTEAYRHRSFTDGPVTD